MKKLGIFLGYGPEQPIKNQGIGRLLAFMINGALERNDIKIVVAIPSWYRKEISELFEDQKIDTSKIEIITTDGEPMLLRLRRLFKRFRKPSQKRPSAHAIRKYARLSARMIYRIIMRWLANTSPVLFVLQGLLVFSAFIITLPIGLVIGLLVSMAFVILRGFKISKILQKRLITKVKNSVKTIFSAHDLQRFRYGTYDNLREMEFNKLTKKLNSRKDINVWYVPALVWPEIRNLKATKVVAVPDIVFYDFPTHYASEEGTIRIHNKVLETLACADHLICYSNYVKENHILNRSLKSEKDISVIPHGVTTLDEYLQPDKYWPGPHGSRNKARNILTEFTLNYTLRVPYLKGIDLSRVHYIFYSSQVRPHKNFINLIKAYKIALREKFIGVKLVVTGDIYTNHEVFEYIQKYGLKADIISLHNVSSEVLAALNYFAVCAVNPTLFEGGFPFTFSEAYSVGTPSIMSSIPVISEQVPDELKEKMLFDPLDVNSIAEKIAWSVSNRKELYDSQKVLYDRLTERTWNQVAREYLDTCLAVTLKT